MTDYKKNNKTKSNKKPEKRGSNIFIKARWKLTIFYTLFISVVVIIFSFAIYFGYLYYLRGDFENELAGEDQGSESELDESENQVEYFTVFFNAPGNQRKCFPATWQYYSYCRWQS